MVFPQVIVFMIYLIFVLFNDSSGIFLWNFVSSKIVYVVLNGLEYYF